MRVARAAAVAALLTLAYAAPAAATPVCTDGYKGGPPSSLCGGRIFPEAELARGYIQYSQDAFGFIEYQHGIEYLAQKYPRWISIFKLSDLYGDDAVSAGPDQLRSYEGEDGGDGRDIQVIKITDHNVPDEGKETLLFSLSVHGNERGGLEGGVRTAEDLAIAAEEGGKIVDGVDNYESSTGREPKFHQYNVADVLAKEAVYLLDFNVDGWAVGDWWNQPAPSTYTRGNSLGTDLNRQMPTIGRINPDRNPLQESEMRYGTQFMHDVAKAGQGGKMAYGADIHGEMNSQAYMDIMYPAGQFDSVDHRRLMAIAERTKSVIDATLYDGHRRGDRERERRQRLRVREGDPTQARALGDRLGHARLHGHGLHRRLHGDGPRSHRDGLRDHVQPHGPGEDLERLSPGEPHQRQPRDHQDRAGVRPHPGDGVQRPERRGRPDRTGRLRGGAPPRHGCRRERPGHAARSRGGRDRRGRPAGRAALIQRHEPEVVPRHECADGPQVQEAPVQGRRARRGAR